MQARRPVVTVVAQAGRAWAVARAGCWALFALLLGLAAVRAAADEATGALPVLRGGWYLWDPYQFYDDHLGHRELSGLDVEITRTVAARAGFEVDIRFRPWDRHLAALREGTADIASGATWSPERAAYLHYSRPYRRETNALYLPRGELPRHGYTDVSGMLASFQASGFRLGAVRGFVYADPAVNAYIADPTNAERVVLVQNEYENLRNLVEGRIDGFIGDRLAAATSAWRSGWRERVEEHPLRLGTDIHFVFSKATVSPEVVARFDEAIAALETKGELRRIGAAYAVPLVLAQTIDRPWFAALDVIGTIAFALSGVLIAARERYSLLGALVLAALPAVGGGVLRDLLVGRSPLAVLASPLSLGLVGATVLGGFLLLHALRFAGARRWLPPDVERAGGGVARQLFEVCDAIGIATFTVTGVAVAVSHRTEPLWVWGPLLAVLTAAGGGILRDIVRQSGNVASLRDAFYAEVPLLWGFLLSLYLAEQTYGLGPDSFQLAVLVTVLGAFASRMAAVHLRLKSPAFVWLGR